MDYNMLRAGDRLAIAVSGGKDSLALLHILRHRQRLIPFDLQLQAIFIDFGLPNFPLPQLEAHFHELNVPYHIESIQLVKDNQWEGLNCFWCSWNRRKALFQLADRLGCNKIAMGHHLDDIIETILMNMIYHAEIGAMKPKQELFHGRMTIIRPMAYEREASLARLAQLESWPSLDSWRCPQRKSTRRMQLKKLIRQLEKENPDTAVNIFRSLQNVKPEYLLQKSVA